eukprot:scaffold44688_cov58-Attheya_sp.AAC.2
MVFEKETSGSNVCREAVTGQFVGSSIAVNGDSGRTASHAGSEDRGDVAHDRTVRSAYRGRILTRAMAQEIETEREESDRIDEKLRSEDDNEWDRSLTLALREEEHLLSVEEELHQDERRMCENCHRCDVLIGRSLEMVRVLKTSLKQRQRNQYKFWMMDCGSASEISLCRECVLFCSINEGSGNTKKSEWNVMWPSYVWGSILLNRQLWQHCGQSTIWSLFPEVVLSNLEDIHPIWDDVTIESQQYDKATKEKKIGAMKKMVVKYCVYNIRCPWGCLAHMRSCDHGFLPLDQLLRHYFCTGMSSPLPVISSTNLQIRQGIKDMVKGARLDYFSFNDCLVRNKSFPIRRCLVVNKEQGACVMTCKLHNGGDHLSYIHSAVNPVTRNLPCFYSDQLSPAVMVPRSIRTVKNHSHNFGFELRRCEGGFDGVDSSFIVQRGRFDFTSVIADKNELLTVYFREDIRTTLDDIVRRGFLSSQLANLLCRRSDELFDDDTMRTTLSELRGGASYVSLTDSMSLLQDLNIHESGKEYFINQLTQLQDSISFVPNWMRRLVYCHPSGSNQYGAPFHRIYIGGIRSKEDSRVFGMAGC